MQDSFSNLNPNQNKDKGERGFLKSIYQVLSRHYILTAVIGLLLFLGSLSYAFTNVKKHSVEKQQQAEQQYQEEMMSEVHTKLQYYMQYGEGDQPTEAASILIAHVLQTGCGDAYKALQTQFDQDSLDYLQDFLNGKSCGEYKSPPVVCTERYKHEMDYLVRLGSNEARYTIEIKMNDERIPTHFKIKKYVEKDLIQ